METDLKGKKVDIPDMVTVQRPWGYYDMFAENMPCTAKVLHIKRKEMLSLQYHRLRSQLYYLLDDFDIYLSDRLVPEEIDGDLNLLQGFVSLHVVKRQYRRGDVICIPQFVIHRPVYNGMQEMGCIVDMAFGHNDENDIVRIQDKYGR